MKPEFVEQAKATLARHGLSIKEVETNAFDPANADKKEIAWFVMNGEDIVRCLGTNGVWLRDFMTGFNAALKFPPQPSLPDERNAGGEGKHTPTNPIPWSYDRYPYRAGKDYEYFEEIIIRAGARNIAHICWGKGGLIEGDEENAKFIIDAANSHASLQAEKQAAMIALWSAVKIASEAYAEWDKANDVRAGKILAALSGRLQNYREDITRIHNLLAGEIIAQPDAQEKELIDAATLAAQYFGECGCGLESCRNCGSRSVPARLRKALKPYQKGGGL